MSVVLTEEYNVMANKEELIGTAEYMMLGMRCRKNRYHFNQVRLYLKENLFY